MSYVTCAFPPELVDSVATTARSLLSRALEHGDGVTGADDLLALCRDARALTIGVLDTERPMRDAVVAFGCVQLAERIADDGPIRCLHVTALAGSDMREWLEACFIPTLEELAREQGAGVISMRGRAGWRRVLGRLGWDEVPDQTGAACMVRRV